VDAEKHNKRRGEGENTWFLKTKLLPFSLSLVCFVLELE
jgi:hypothetical protein